MGKILPHPSALRSPGQTIVQVGSQLHPSVNRLPKDSPGTKPPLISTRDKATHTRGIGISSTYQGAGISPSHQEAYNKPPIPTSANGGGADTRSKTGYNSIIYKKVTTPKTYKNEKTENYNSDEGERKNPRKSAKQGGDSQPPGKRL